MSPPTGLRRVDAYLASLPNGLASYPDIVQKASVYREFIRFLPTGKLLGKLPEPVEALLTKPRSASAWVCKVHTTALMLGLAETAFAGDEDFVARCLVANKELLTGPLYRLLMMVASPAYLAKNSETRWNTFHRGVKMVTESLPEGKTGTVRLRLEYPKKLIPDLLARSYTTAFQAALEAAGARGVAVEVVRYDDEACTFKCTWA